MLLRLFAPQVLFYGLVTLGSALLNSHRRFAAAAFAPVRQQRDAHLRAAGGLAGHGPRHQRGRASSSDTVARAAPRAGDDRRHRGHGPGAVAGHHPGPDPGAVALRRCATRPCGRWPRLSGWTLGYVVVNQVTLFVIISLAFGTPGGAGVSAWTYAYQFFQLPYGVFTVSVMMAFTPELASLATPRQTGAAFQDRFLFGLRLVVLVLLPSTVIFVRAGPARS